MPAKMVAMQMISDFNTFRKSWEKDATDPAKTVMYYLIAGLNVERNINVARPMISILVRKDDCKEDPSSPSGLALGRTQSYFVEQLKYKPNVARSYLGGTPENGYKVKENALVMTLLKADIKGDEASIIIQSGGKDLNTPVALARNQAGQWKITECSSIITGVKEPKSRDF